MKNHILVNGKLLQTNKKFSDLKNSQKELISNWLYEAYSSLAKDDGTLLKKDKERVFSMVKEGIEERGIWIPFGEVIKYFNSKQHKYRKRYLKEISDKIPIEK